MNQNQIQQLTLHLSQALDQNYDVVNMETVLSVIYALEGTTITKEQLEATRLAKYINQLRRRTTNESLARRAKSLLKKWREMVGIQQNTHDSQPLQAQQSFKPIIVNNISSSESSAIADTVVDRVPVSDSTEITNFSNFIRHINIENSNDSIVNNNNSIRNQQTVVNKPVTFINEHSVNLVCNEPSIVIDIVTDSDDNNEQSEQLCKFTPSSSSLSYPTLFPRNQTKKIKKDKKHRERERETRVRPSSFLQQQQQQQQSSRFNGFTDGKVPTDSEILSLSNSSMSSILSVEVISGNSQSQGKFRTTTTTTAPDLTFAGRFKSVINNRVDNSVLPPINDQKDAPEVLHKKLMNDEINNVNNDDTSTSCSRLSAFEEEHQQQQQEMPALKSSYEKEKGAEPLSPVPKKRGRKKGSKGVDSIIAKKESSLSQQIFFGSTAGAGVKKVKTTKELFNEIQSRKLSISFNRSDQSSLSTTGIINKTSNHNVQTRPASSCSETSVNSPHTLETYASTKSTLDDVVCTDSDTVSSERQTSPSFDSNSNYSNLQNASVRNNNTIDVTALDHNNFDNVKTQLMHLVHSFSSPLSITDTERLYESQLVPCTCHIVEEISTAKEPEESESDTAANQTIATDIVQGTVGNSNQLAVQTNKIENSNESKHPSEEISALSAKPVKSIFDLDFDDNVDDTLSLSIVKDVQVTQNNTYSSKNRVDNVDMSIPGISTESNSCLDIQLSYQEENNEVTDDVIVAVATSLYTVQEDPDCLAKQRFNLQTRDVTGFHINALHNYYVPNINGNWNNINDILPTKPYPTISELLETLETYAVSDGADVVPKYGSLTYGRIRKDLTSHKFAKCFKPRTPKSSMAPFLGIAKCLLSCRRAAKRQWYILKQESTKLSSELTIKDNQSPLSVDVNEHVDIFAKSPSQSQGQLEYRFDQDTYNSRNLLKMSEESIEGTVEIINSRHHNKGSNSSNSSTKRSFSLPYNEDSIRSTHTERTLVERNRKKRRKEQVMGQEPRIKRIKIALNGNVAIQRQISHSSEDGEVADEKIQDEQVQSDVELSDTENESSLGPDTENSNDENDTDVEEVYAIVQKPLLSGNNNNLVLTIKKTPSKINSPINPEVESIIKPTKVTINQSNSTSSSYGQRNQCIMAVREACLSNLHRYSHYRRRRRRRRVLNGPHSNRFRDQKYSCQHEEPIDLELKHLFQNNNNLNPRPILKTHQKLFFMNELNRVDNAGETERIINYSSSSDDSDEFDENNLEKEKKDCAWSGGELENTTTDHKRKIKLEPGTDLELETEAGATKEETQDMQNTAESYLSSSDEDASVNQQDSVNDSENDAALINKAEDGRLYNNGMLPSFNSIDDKKKSICYDNLNYNLDSSCSSLENHVEYRSGIRTVVAHGGEPEEDCAQIQQFREWHEILQLKSYNNEPLVVLPYVVLE